MFHSNRYLWQVILKDHGVQALTHEAVDEQIIENYAALIGRYQAQREALPADRLVEMAYSDLRNDPVGTLSKVYAQLGLGAAPVEAITQYQQQRPTYQTQRYETSPELAERLRSALEPSPSTRR